MMLAIHGDEKEVAACLQLAPRLRAAELVAIDDIHEFDRDACDGVVICSRTDLEDNCRVAAACGKHVLAAALPASSAEATALIQEFRSQNVRLMVGFSNRFLPSVRAIRQSLDSGQLGDPGLIRIHRWKPQVVHAADPSADVDLAIWMFRAMPTEVYAIARRPIPHAGDYLQVHLGFPAGGMGLIDVFQGVPSAGGYFSLSLIGSTGAAYADDHHNRQLLLRDEHFVALKTGTGAAAQLALLQEFADAIKEQREPVATGADALAALRVCEAARQSLECGRPARLVGEHYEC